MPILQTPKTNELVLLDTNVFAAMASGFLNQCIEILKHLQAKDVWLVVPKVVQCELLKNSFSPAVYRETEEQLYDSFVILDLDVEIMDAACKLNSLYHWNAAIRNKVQKKNIFNDMIIGTMAAHSEKRGENNPSYILSEDGDFLSPYFYEVEYCPLLDQRGRPQKYLHLYRVNREQANIDWKAWTEEEKRRKSKKTSVWTSALKEAGIKSKLPEK